MAQNWQEALDKMRQAGLPGLRGSGQQQPGPYASGYVFPQTPPSGQTAPGTIGAGFTAATSGYGQIPTTPQDAPAIKAIRDRVIELKQIVREIQGAEPFPEDVLQHIERTVRKLSIIDLVAELERVQDDLKTFSFPLPPEETLIPTEGLAQGLSIIQALAQQQDITQPSPESDEPAPISEIVSTTDLLSGMDRDSEPTPVVIVDQTGEPALPFGIAAPAPAPAEPAEEEDDEPTQDVTATEAMGQEADLPEGSEFLGVGGALGLAWFNVPDDAEEEDD